MTSTGGEVGYKEAREHRLWTEADLLPECLLPRFQLYDPGQALSLLKFPVSSSEKCE